MSPINPTAQSSDPAAAAFGDPVAAVRATTSGTVNEDSATAQSEAVTLSADASTTAQLLDAARASDGVNQTTVQQLQTAVQNNTYSVAPEKLANAILNAFKESAP